MGAPNFEPRSMAESLCRSVQFLDFVFSAELSELINSQGRLVKKLAMTY